MRLIIAITGSTESFYFPDETEGKTKNFIKNLKENYSEIKHLLNIAGLEEDVSWRNKGSKRNRLFLRT